MMKKKWYRSNLAKGILVIAEHIALVTAVFSIIAVMAMYGQGIRITDDSEGTYISSRGFAEEVYNISRDIVLAINNNLAVNDNPGVNGDSGASDDPGARAAAGAPRPTPHNQHSGANDDSASGQDTSRVVDLKEIYEGTELTYTNTSGLAYRLEDLRNWAQSGWSWGDGGYTEGQNIIACTKADGTCVYYRYAEFARLFRDGELKFDTDAYGGEESGDAGAGYVENGDAGFGDTGTGDTVTGDTETGYIESGDTETEDSGEWGQEDEEDITSKVMAWFSSGQMPEGLEPTGISGILNASGEVEYVDACSYTEMTVEERYSPVGADSILEAVNSNPQWNGRLRQAYEALNEALNLMGSASAQTQLLKHYREGNTNLTYLYINTDARKLYTNKSVFNKYEDYENYLKLIAAQDMPYMIVRPALSECETNLNADTYTWQHMVETESGSNRYVYAVQIDDEFPVGDVLANKQKNYDTYIKWQMPVLAVGIISVIIFFAGLVWLTAAAGRSPEDEKLYLCTFDKWFTEVAAVLVIVIWLSGVGLVGRYVSLWEDNLQNRVSIASLAVYTASLFLIGYLSLVRRIKARSLWKNSLLRWLLLHSKQAFKRLGGFMEIFSRNTSSKIKTTLLMGGFLVFQFVAYAFIFLDGTGVFGLILLAADAAALLYLLMKADGRDRILEGLKRITEGELQYKIPLDRLTGEQKTMAEYINHIGEGLDAAVESSLKNERMKTELITNVSHDIKTPLTSIINYVDLLKRENFTDPKICGYLDILEAKAQRLKTLTEDVVEASKVSTGNITLDMADLNFGEMIHQVIGEFEEKFQEKHLTIMVHFAEEPAVICADGQRMWRVLENIFNNAVKYAMEGTRVYADVKVLRNKVYFALKNISAQPLNISADELTERFIRGDVSRNTEGSGLGLSIAQSLVQLQGGEFKLYLDGDLFKVVISFPLK
ncbi:MAG: HAMP domain-containing sensor histidine kinase [Eubacteriales bacterium]|nr:HAMP domain-containing sensor histidine kinase [Eubacteriales bacterium]